MPTQSDSAWSLSPQQHLKMRFASSGQFLSLMVCQKWLVSDNGMTFTSREFQEFMQRNGIRHVTSAPYHPASNGSAERAVQTFKDALRKSTAGDLETQLARFLFHYRSTPHSSTRISPAEMIMGRRLRRIWICYTRMLLPRFEPVN